ncbi:hypothetical protein V1280_001703 [Bradyrhizobium sp. AZCC 2230]
MSKVYVAPGGVRFASAQRHRRTLAYGPQRANNGPPGMLRLSDSALSTIAAGAKLLKPICEQRMRA